MFGEGSCAGGRDFICALLGRDYNSIVGTLVDDFSGFRLCIEEEGKKEGEIISK